MKLSLDRWETATVVSLEGRVDAFDAPEVSRQLDAAVADCRRPLLLDLGGVTFMDTTALLALLRSTGPGEGRRIPMLCNVHERVQIVLTLTRLNRAFRIYDTREEALDAIRRIPQPSGDRWRFQHPPSARAANRTGTSGSGGDAA